MGKTQEFRSEEGTGEGAGGAGQTEGVQKIPGVSGRTGEIQGLLSSLT